MDYIPPEALQQLTMLDKLEPKDTLYIDTYIASAGEFGGYDEGLWIWKEGDIYKGQFSSLTNTYTLGRQEHIIAFYKKFRNQSKPLSDPFIMTEEKLKAIKYFLVETQNYNHELWVSNAPEQIAVYCKNYSYALVYHDHSWAPYLRLKEKMKD